MSIVRKLNAKLKRFSRREDGAMTVFGLYVMMIMATLSIFSLEVANLMSARSQLQMSADAAAHAALYYRDTHTAAEARKMAVRVAEFEMPPDRFGTVLKPEDIKFGLWDYATQTFKIDETSRKSVMVSTKRSDSNLNPIQGFVSNWIGKDTWNVMTPAVFTTYRPSCLREGFVADGVVDIQSNNGFANGFCVHSNTKVSLNNNNTFEAGTVVSMPDVNNISLPKSGFDTNDGLKQALRSSYYRLRIVNRLANVIDGIKTGDPEYIPPYITSTTPIALSKRKLTIADFTPGRIHTLDCGTSGKATIDAGGEHKFQGEETISNSEPDALSKVVLVTSCDVKFSAGSVLEDVIIATTSTAPKSISAPSSLQVGRDDNCADGGGSQILTMGSMDYAADLKIFGGQLLAQKDINFAANADGIQGASMVAGGQVNGTSNMNMGFCGTGMANNFEAEYFRLAR